MTKYCYDCSNCGPGYCEISGAPVDERDTIDDDGNCRPCRNYREED
ncbi:hypothetical protein ACFLRW_02250 [Acidobacteriota bacterium]